MNIPITDLQQLLRSMEPVLNDGVFVFVTLPHGTDFGPLDAVATIRESEGLTVVVKEEVAKRLQLSASFRAAWITLTVHSDLQAVGLTAAFAGALGQAGISCNVIAGVFHDHIFVPVELAPQTMSVLRALQKGISPD